MELRFLGVIIALVMASAATAQSATVGFAHGPLAIAFDDQTGAMVRVECHGELIAECDASVPAVTFWVGPLEHAVPLEEMGVKPRLLKKTVIGDDTVELLISAGDYEVVERYRLHADRPRMDRWARLIYHGKETVKLRKVAFRTAGIKASQDGFYRFPATWPVVRYPFAQMHAGAHHGARGSTAPAVAQLSAGRSLLWSAYCDDSPAVEIIEGDGQFEARQIVEAAGYLNPGAMQDIGFVSMQLCDGDYWAALRQLREWMGSVGLKVPADQPEWIHDAILYSFHPGGTIYSMFKDLGGFEPASQRLLPAIRALGANAVWIMPIEARGPYFPQDYYRLQDGLGSFEQYRQLVARAHGLGLHVLQDIVPHGGTPSAVHNVAHPEFMLRREDGTTLNSWLNDFAWPQWQQFMGQVARHYVKEFGIDGYRVDAIFGSKEMNWNPKIPYARASLAQLRGGLDMLRVIRDAVKQERGAEGAVLAEVESARHMATADAMYDFTFCYAVCHEWRKRDASSFAAGLAEFFEEQQYVNPPGTVLLRHVESHDSLRSQLWHGVRGMRAMYALSAWIDGIPMIYQDMEIGHSFEIERINRIRRERPELSRGTADYRAVRCDAPGVFTCLRTLGERGSVVAINFNREPVDARLSWPGGSARAKLAPMGYAVLPEGAADGAAIASVAAQTTATPGQIDDPLDLSSASEWFIDTLEGRLHDRANVGRHVGPALATHWATWRPQNTGVIWEHHVLPLHPVWPRVGFKMPDGRWRVIEFAKNAVCNNVRVIERLDGKPGLWLAGTKGETTRVSDCAEMPGVCDVTLPAQMEGVSFCCVGSQYIVSNRHFTVVLQRQGGVIRTIERGNDVLAENQDFYADQEYFARKDIATIHAMHDVECGVRIWTADHALHLCFDGQLRGLAQGGVFRPALRYHNEYTFTDQPRFEQQWSFRTDKGIHDRKAFLAFTMNAARGERFRFVREGQPVADEPLGAGHDRRGQTRGKSLPETIAFLADGKPVVQLTNLRGPASVQVNAFVVDRKLFITLLDGGRATMDQNRWHEFQGTWQVPVQ